MSLGYQAMCLSYEVATRCQGGGFAALLFVGTQNTSERHRLMSQGYDQCQSKNMRAHR